MRINITNCYCLFLTIALIMTMGCSAVRENILVERCDRIEEELETIKKEAVSNDYQSLIQLQGNK